MIEIRAGSAADGPAIARVRRESWHAAYEGIIAASLIGRATALGGAAADPPPYRRTLVAETGEHPALIGYASFGPERSVASVTSSLATAAVGRPGQHAPQPPGADSGTGGDRPAPDPCAVGSDRPAPDPCAAGSVADPHPLTANGRAGFVGELYALYVTPAWWSAGAGRALMDLVLASLEADGYRQVVLWVLADNARARRFYDRAGFAPDGGTNIITGLGGVLEVRYAREL
jgi:ribosomal protein S18 acetylase RimI-like enzyme